MIKKNVYEEKATQKKRLLEVLKQGKKVTQIDLGYYLMLRKKAEEVEWYPVDRHSEYVDALAELGIANLPARIFGLKKDGYNIVAEDVKVKGRFGNTHYAVYSLKTGQ